MVMVFKKDGSFEEIEGRFLQSYIVAHKREIFTYMFVK